MFGIVFYRDNFSVVFVADKLRLFLVFVRHVFLPTLAYISLKLQIGALSRGALPIETVLFGIVKILNATVFVRINLVLFIVRRGTPFVAIAIVSQFLQLDGVGRASGALCAC